MASTPLSSQPSRYWEPLSLLSSGLHPFATFASSLHTPSKFVCPPTPPHHTALTDHTQRTEARRTHQKRTACTAAAHNHNLERRTAEAMLRNHLRQFRQESGLVPPSSQQLTKILPAASAGSARWAHQRGRTLARERSKRSKKCQVPRPLLSLSPLMGHPAPWAQRAVATRAAAAAQLLPAGSEASKQAEVTKAVVGAAAAPGQNTCALSQIVFHCLHSVQCVCMSVVPDRVS